MHHGESTAEGTGQAKEDAGETGSATASQHPTERRHQGAGGHPALCGQRCSQPQAQCPLVPARKPGSSGVGLAAQAGEPLPKRVQKM